MEEQFVAGTREINREQFNKLLIEVSLGRESAFRELFDRYRPNIYTTALRVSNNEWMAEDIVQDTFIKVWLNKHLLPELESFEAWLYVMARNIALNILKKQQQYKVFAEQEARLALVRFSSEADLLAQDNDFQKLLKRAVQRLPEKQRLTYHLIKERYMKREEAAKELGVSPETVKWNLDQAMKSIRAYCVSNMKDVPLVVLLYLLFKSL